MNKKIIKCFFWIIIAVAGASSLGGIALIRGEKISSLWFICATLCCGLLGYRFYSAWIATKILRVDEHKKTPAIRFDDGKDFVPTNRWIVFGHHFAAIAGPGPLIGPTLAVQFGYLPGTLWIVIGSVLAGAVQDMIILFASLRRDSKSLGKMIEDEIGKVAGFCALIGTFAIIIILIAVLGLIVVKALAHSPWGSFTVLMTIPIAMIVGIYLFHIRPAGVLEASIVGVLLFLLAVYGGGFIHNNPYLAKIFDQQPKFLAFCIIFYGFLAAVLPVWLLLAPRDYLSSFLKIGTISLMAIALLIFHPQIQMPALTNFGDNDGLIFNGKIFPFLFITIGCGAISGFHALVASGTTPKLIANEKDVRLVGYGSMLLEGFVAMMALITACVLDPAIYFAINTSAATLGADAVATLKNYGFNLNLADMEILAKQMGENSLMSRTGGAPSLAVGMAKILSSAFGENMLAMWYHFAIMFEAIFILTTLDAGTRVARFMFEDICKFRDKKFHESNLLAIFSSAVVVFCWGYFLYIGVIDPNGGVNILWPLFGMSNQILACIALCLATVILYKIKKKYSLITALPLLFIAINTSSAVIIKIFSNDSRIGFLATAKLWQQRLDSGFIIDEMQIDIAKKVIFNQQLVATLAMFFLIILWIIILCSLKRIYQINLKNSKLK
jgi:carbon starvation protein